MDLLFICRDGLENSVIGNVVMAMEAKKAGSEVGVLFTQEALAALCGVSLDWSPALRERETRMKVSRNAKKMGIPLASAKDERWTDVRQLRHAAGEAGVQLYACPLWVSLLGLNDFPPGVNEISLPEVLRMLQETKRVIGSLYWYTPSSGVAQMKRSGIWGKTPIPGFRYAPSRLPLCQSYVV